MANNVSTYHYDNDRTGWNPKEKLLTPSVVGGATFGLLFQYGPAAIDAIMYAQPLYVQGVTINGAKHNVVFVATQAATIYAFDADTFQSGAQPWLWRRFLLNSGEQAADGVKSTPVIDATRRIMYVIGRLQNAQGKIFFRLHAIDIRTGKDVVGIAPFVIDRNSVPEAVGTGDPQGAPGRVYFDPAQHWNRPGLLLAHKAIYAAFGSTGDDPPYHGWVMGFRASNLSLIGAYCTTPDANAASSGPCWCNPDLGGGIWQAGFGLSADKEKHVYCMTANGIFGTLGGNPARNYADCLIKLTDKVKLVGSFAPPDPLALTAQDVDFGSAGAIVLPNGQGRKKFVVGCGKDANVYLIETSRLTPQTLGHVANFRSTNRLASNPGANTPGCGTGPGIWGGPAYYGGALGEVIYYCGSTGPLQALLLGMNEKIYYNRQTSPGGAWHGQAALGGNAKEVAVAINHKGTLDLFFIGLDDKIYHNRQKKPGGPWHGKVPLHGVARQIVVGTNQNGSLEIFYIGADSNIYHNWQKSPGGKWHGGTALGGSARQIAVGTNKNGTLEIFYVGTDDMIYHNWQTTPGGTWNGEAPLPLAAAGVRGDTFSNIGAAQQVTVGLNKNGTLEVFYIGSDYQIYHNWQTSPGGPWYGATHGETALIPPPVGPPNGGARNVGDAQQVAVATNKNGSLEIFYIGRDNNIYHNWQTTPGGSWNGEAALGGSAKYLAVGQNQSGTLEIFYVGMDDRIYHNWQTTPGGFWNGGIMLWGTARQVAVGRNKSGTLEIFYVAGALTQAYTATSVPNATPPSEVIPNEGGLIPFVTSNGSKPGTGVVWGILRPDNANQLHLRAYDAADLTKGHLFDATIGSWSGGGAFLAPIVVNGKAYVAADRQLCVYGT